MKKINKTQVERTIETREPFPSSISSETKEILCAKMQRFAPPPHGAAWVDKNLWISDLILIR